MKSIKPGRGPSMMSGIVGIGVALFGVLWTIIAASSGGGLFALFGVIFVAIAVVQVVYNFKNATGKNRYSSFDITDENEEPDPFNERFGNNSYAQDDRYSYTESSQNYCPYCGAKTKEDFEFCTNCGKKLP